MTAPGMTAAALAALRSSRLSVAVVDDQETAQANLDALLRAYAREHEVEFDISQFPSGHALLRHGIEDFSIVFLDVVMPVLDGFETAMRVRSLDIEVELVFVTSMVTEASRGYEVDAAGYVVKPVNAFDLSHTLNRILTRIAARRSAPGAFLSVSTESGLSRIAIESILVVECSGRDLTISTLAGVYETKGTLKALEQSLTSHGFVRCHHAALINVHHVRGLDQQHAKLIDGSHVQVSRSKRRALMDSILDHSVRS